MFIIWQIITYIFQLFQHQMAQKIEIPTAPVASHEMLLTRRSRPNQFTNNFKNTTISDRYRQFASKKDDQRWLIQRTRVLSKNVKDPRSHHWREWSQHKLDSLPRFSNIHKVYVSYGYFPIEKLKLSLFIQGDCSILTGLVEWILYWPAFIWRIFGEEKFSWLTSKNKVAVGNLHFQRHTNFLVKLQCSVFYQPLCF